MTSLKSWFVIYPDEVNSVIKSEFEKLGLNDSGVSVIVVSDGLSEKEVDARVNFVNKNLKYSGFVDESSAEDLLDKIEGMGGVEGDDLFIMKDGKIARKRLKF